MFPAFPNNNLECAKLHLEFDRGFFCAAEKAVCTVIDLTKDAKEPLFFDTILPRMLFVAQSMCCIVFLPFKMIAAFTMGLAATVFTDEPSLQINALYSIVSVGAYAAAIPTGFLLACQPTSVLKDIRKAKAAFEMLSPQQWMAAAQQNGLRMWGNLFRP